MRVRFWISVAWLFLATTLLAQTSDTLANYGGITSIAASYNIDDQQRVVLVAARDGDVHEIYYTNPTTAALPARHGDSVIGHYDNIVAISGFYNEDDHFRVAIIATADGNIREMFYHPTKGRGESVLTNLGGVMSVAGFYNRDDRYRVVLAATRNGDVYEIFYSPTKGKGQGLLAHYDNLIAIAGTFMRDTNDRCLAALTAGGRLVQLLYHPKRGRREVVVNILPRNSRSVAINRKVLVIGTSNGSLARYALDSGGIISTAFKDGISGLHDVAVDSYDATNIVYSTDDGSIHKFLPPPAQPAPPPTKVTFTASPNNGYINFGESATLTWSVANCAQPCDVSMQGRDGFNYAEVLMNASKLAISGSMTVTPTRSTMTKYTLTAKSSSTGSEAKSVVVQLYRAPAPSGQVFYFRMTNSSSTVLRCFTMAIIAADEASAKSMAESQNGGYSATAITYSDFLNGC